MEGIKRFKSSGICQDKSDHLNGLRQGAKQEDCGSVKLASLCGRQNCCIKVSRAQRTEFMLGTGRKRIGHKQREEDKKKAVNGTDELKSWRK
ncbi:hypothetical protein PAMP_019001 [Pampus punctatissimus]